MYYKEIYTKGEQLYNKRFDEFIKNNPDYGHEDDYIGTCEEDSYYRSEFSIEEELDEECAVNALEDDGYSRIGQLTPEEIYYMLASHYSDETANEYLAEIEYFKYEAVA